MGSELPNGTSYTSLLPPGAGCPAAAHRTGADEDGEEGTRLLQKPAGWGRGRGPMLFRTGSRPPWAWWGLPLGTAPGGPGGSSPYARDVLILSAAFLLVFMAFNSTQNLESSINKDKGLGSTALGVLYCSFTVFAFAAPLAVRHLGSKRAMLTGLSGYWLFVAANLAPSWYTLIPSSIFLGFCAAILWVGQGTYLTWAARGHAALAGTPEEAAIGSFNGTFYGLLAINQVVGNLVAFVVLKLPTWLGWGRGSPAEAAQAEGRAKQLLFATLLLFMTLGTLLAFFMRPQTAPAPRGPGGGAGGGGNGGGEDGGAPAGADSLGVLEFVRASAVLLRDRRMVLLVPVFLYSGFQQAFIWGDFTKDVVTPVLGVSWIGGVMAAFGTTDALAAMVAGRLSSGLRSITSILAFGAAFQLLSIVYLLTKGSYAGGSAGDFGAIFAVAMLWGVGDATVLSQLGALLPILFPNDLEAAYALWKLWGSLSTSAVFLLSPYITFVQKLRTLAVLVVLAIAAILGGVRS